MQLVVPLRIKAAILQPWGYTEENRVKEGENLGLINITKLPN